MVFKEVNLLTKTHVANLKQNRDCGPGFLTLSPGLYALMSLIFLFPFGEEILSQCFSEWSMKPLYKKLPGVLVKYRYLSAFLSLPNQN